MTAEDVLDFYQELEKLKIPIWLDGGWGVDALLERQTRLHQDLDIIIQQKDVEVVQRFLTERKYHLVPRDDTTDLNFHLSDDHGHEIDFTVIWFDEEGNGIYGPKENGEMNPADSFKGRGTINDYPVQCVSPEFAVQFHTGYEKRDIDRQDVLALCQKFDISVPDEYKSKQK